MQGSARILQQPGKDPSQALKVTIAAALGGKEVYFEIAKSQPTDPQAPHLQLILPDGSPLTNANAISRYLGPTRSGLQALLQDQWLEFEERKLCAHGRDTEAFQRSLRLLEAAVSQSSFLTGNEICAADAAVFTVLHTLPRDLLTEPLQQYTHRIQSLPEVLKAVSKISSAASPSADAVNQQSSKRPLPGRRNILITSALPYVNNVPHLGNIIGSVLSADCYARYCRARQHNVLYVCGTDEYGTATEAKALEEGLTCQAICDKYFAAHRDIYRWFDIGFDHFGRTPTWQQTEIAQAIFKTLEKQGRLTEQTVEQLYSEAAGKFLADRFVSGTCPNADCAFEDARGDQCDKCGRLLNPTELLNPRCKLTGTTPVLRSTRHFFLDLPSLTPELQAYIDRTFRLGGWSANCVQVTNAWMRDGLKMRAITRDLKWGTPVPREGYEDKVFYVWFDAPIGYISITANYTEQWEEWWRDPENVELVQFMGKDNVPFHTIIFPATLLGTQQTWTMMKSISVTEYLNYEGSKFSKRAGVGVFGDDTRRTGIPVEVWRYYLLSNRPETSDADFKWSDLAAKSNSELKNNLGNFINRTLKFVTKKDTGFDSRVPVVHATKGLDKVRDLGQEVSELVQRYIDCMDRIKLREAIKTAMAVSAAGNKFFQEHQIFKLVKADHEECSTLLAACVGLVLLLAALTAPFMPSLSAKVLEYMRLPPEAAALTDELLAKAAAPHTLLPAGHAISEPAPLIAEITAQREAELREAYRGSQAERAATPASTASSVSSAGLGKKARTPKHTATSAASPAHDYDKTSTASKAKAAARKQNSHDQPGQAKAMTGAIASSSSTVDGLSVDSSS